MVDLHRVYDSLAERFGPQGWWPLREHGYHKSNPARNLTESEMLEICIGAILTQNTSWTNVEKALTNLQSVNLADLQQIVSIDETKLAELIKSSGYFNQKAKKLKLFASHVLTKHKTLASLFDKRRSTIDIRQELLSLWGIGPETADSMLLYAARRPTFVIDAYTKRIFSRIGICKPDVDYDSLQSRFHQALLKDHESFNEYHALIVELAKNNCTKTAPDCATCPLANVCEKRITKHL